MSKKYFTLIIVPDAQAQFKQIKVPYLLTRGLIVAGILGVVVLIALSYYMVNQYQNMTQISKEFPQVRKVAKDQRYVIERYEENITELRQMVSRLKLANAKLLLLAGVENPSNVPVNFGVGGTDGSNDISALIDTTRQKSDTALLDRVNNLTKLREMAVDQEELSQRLMEFFQDQKTVLASTPSIWPVRGWVTSNFGSRNSPFTGHKTFHPALDIATKTGTPIVSPADGIVSYAGVKSGFGNVLVIDHGYGYVTFYGHCSKLNVKDNDKVKRGDVVAYVGSTGASTGPHLHYEVRVHGVATNPTKYILDL